MFIFLDASFKEFVQIPYVIVFEASSVVLRVPSSNTLLAYLMTLTVFFCLEEVEPFLSIFGRIPLSSHNPLWMFVFLTGIVSCAVIRISLCCSQISSADASTKVFFENCRTSYYLFHGFWR